MDPGMKIWRAARSLTPEQLAEMLAVKQTSLVLAAPSPILATHWPTYAPLVRAGLMTWDAAPAEWGSKWRRPTLTTKGERAMLARMEWDLRAAGALPAEPEAEAA